MSDNKPIKNSSVVKVRFYDTGKTGKLVIHIRKGLNIKKVIQSSFLTIGSRRKGKKDEFTWAFDVIRLMRKRATGTLPKLQTGPQRISLPLPILLEDGDTFEISRLIKKRKGSEMRRKTFDFHSKEKAPT